MELTLPENISFLGNTSKDTDNPDLGLFLFSFTTTPLCKDYWPGVKWDVFLHVSKFYLSLKVCDGDDLGQNVLRHAVSSTVSCR